MLHQLTEPNKLCLANGKKPPADDQRQSQTVLTSACIGSGQGRNNSQYFTIIKRCFKTHGGPPKVGKKG
jgi:hypothetical protein